MQADVYGSAVWKQFRLYVTLGLQPSYYPGPEPGDATPPVEVQPPWSREHYVMWHDDPASTEGLYLRVGRFMPVFGLRLAEHNTYIRRYGGTPLYAETYGAAAAYVTAKYEGHLTAFIKDPLIDTVEHSNGVAAYGELRLDSKTAIGAEGMFTASVDDRKLRGGVTGKRFLSRPDVLLQAELQLVDLMIPHGNADHSTTYTYQVVGELLGTWFPANAFQVDAGVGYYNENVRIHGVYRNAFDLNVHWYATSHIEAVLLARYEPNDVQVADQPVGAYVLAMLHYRL
jgi:hypothetical protein